MTRDTTVNKGATRSGAANRPRVSRRLTSMLAAVALVGAAFAATTSRPEANAAAITADPVIAAAGDMACGAGSTGASCRELATSDLMIDMQTNDRLDAVIPLGDVQYECGEIENFFLNDNSNPARGYNRTWGRPSLKAITTPVVGNHEYASSAGCLPQAPGASGYYTYFGQAASPLDQNCTATCKGYYSYDLDSWHIVVLNSNCSKVGGCGTTSPQNKWLIADLAATNKPCIAAAFHQPRFSSSNRASTSMHALWNTLHAGGTDVVLSGHEHSYERFDRLGTGDPTTLEPTLDPNGMRLFVVGTGGRNLSSFAGPIRTGSQVRNSTTFGVLRMVLHPDSYDWNFVPIAGQTFTDTGTTQCGPPIADTQPPTVSKAVTRFGLRGAVRVAGQTLVPS